MKITTESESYTVTSLLDILGT